ncbi:MAG: alpha/beta hydrolase [Eubacteriales bacterium]|nr:alpha/beta hydrolase [Eubacteriales bacterium]MDY3332886.1 alpha/beta hydrolase [Gallibacter sp.]
MKETNPIGSLSKNEIPICFIHGEDDVFIKPEHSKKMYKNNKLKAEIHIIPKAGHANSREVLGVEQYREIVANFLNNI